LSFRPERCTALRSGGIWITPVEGLWIRVLYDAMKYMFSRPLSFSYIHKACGFEAATRFPSILLSGSLITIVVCGEAVPALRPAGILPAAENKGKMPSPHGDGFPPAKHVLDEIAPFAYSRISRAIFSHPADISMFNDSLRPGIKYSEPADARDSRPRPAAAMRQPGR